MPEGSAGSAGSAGSTEPAGSTESAGSAEPAGAPAPHGDPLTAVASALHALGRELDGLSLAELLWLAAGTQARPGTGATDPADPAAAPPGSSGTEDPRERTGEWGRLRRPVYGPAAPGGEALPARAVTVPGGSALPRAREIARALRPLRRPWAAGRRQQLDLPRTVARYARSGELLPAFSPAPERWFDLSVVVDRSPTMAVWGETVDELLKVLATTGAFRTLRVREVDTWEAGAEAEPRIRGPQKAAGTARQRRLTLVVSDCVPGAGADNWLWDQVHAWAGATPTVLVNPLPPKIWRHSGLDLPAVKVTTPGAPGVHNAQLRFLAPPLLEDAFGPPGNRTDTWLPLPVVGLSPRSVARWARTLMRGDPAGCDAVLVPEPGLLGRPAAPPDAPPDAGQLVDAFLHRASANAVRLAVLCSPYPRMHSGLLHLVRQELVPEASAADMAEVVVGGLVSVEEGEPGRGGPVLRFRDGVRERLAPRLGARDAARTRDAVSRFMAAHTAAPSRFPALVPEAEGGAEVTADHAPFAEVHPEVLGEAPTPAGEPGPQTSAVAPLVEAAASGRPTQSARVRPYFFLSYAHTPRYGATGADPDMWVERLFRDLCGHVMALTDLPTGYPVGFMDREIRTGEGWSERLSTALADCRVFVPLYSPRYFASEMCGKEWFAFAQRTAQHGAFSGQPAEAIVPALWVPVPPSQLPAPAERLQFSHHAFGERYVTDGLYGLLKLRGYADEYERAVYELAKRIVRVGESVRLDPIRPMDFPTVPSAFGTATSYRGSLRIAVAAPTRENLPEGRSADYYGNRPDDWNPYHPLTARTLAHTAADLAYQLNNQVEASTLEDEVALARHRRISGPLILLVDLWALEVPAIGRALAALDTYDSPGTSIVVAWSRQDRESVEAAPRLSRRLATTVPNLLRRSGRSGEGVLGLEDFNGLMPQVLTGAYDDYLRPRPRLPMGDSSFRERPRLYDPLGRPPAGPGSTLEPE
ncbi:TIR-like protein FxsC [Streptomyces sp. NPDC048340]|uniref:TIR-like protein FxsC n=1 Tax=Streptomyces sp. NPDC048340 TaxID=3365537 RepID=UPI0037115AD5